MGRARTTSILLHGGAGGFQKLKKFTAEINDTFVTRKPGWKKQAKTYLEIVETIEYFGNLGNMKKQFLSRKKKQQMIMKGEGTYR